MSLTTSNIAILIFGLTVVHFIVAKLAARKVMQTRAMRTFRMVLTSLILGLAVFYLHLRFDII